MSGTSDWARSGCLSHQELGVHRSVGHVDLMLHLPFALHAFIPTHFERHLDRQRVVLNPFGAEQIVVCESENASRGIIVVLLDVGTEHPLANILIGVDFVRGLAPLHPLVAALDEERVAESHVIVPSCLVLQQKGPFGARSVLVERAAKSGAAKSGDVVGTVGHVTQSEPVPSYREEFT